MAFHIGQKVVCVGGWVIPRLAMLITDTPPIPTVNSIYTITEIFDYGNVTALNFAELRSDGFGVYRPGFMSIWFRPVKTTSIEIFERMLKNAPAKEDA